MLMFECFSVFVIPYDVPFIFPDPFLANETKDLQGSCCVAPCLGGEEAGALFFGPVASHRDGSWP